MSILDDEAKARVAARLRATRPAPPTDPDEDPKQAERRAAEARYGADLGRHWASELATYQELRRLAREWRRPWGLLSPTVVRAVEGDPARSRGTYLIRVVSDTFARQEDHAFAFWAALIHDLDAARRLCDSADFVDAFAEAACRVWDEVEPLLGDHRG